MATFTSWNLRTRDSGAENELLTLAGGYIPFSKTVADREQTGDPRPALLERYRDFGDYRTQFAAAARKLIEQRYILEEDFDRLMAEAEKRQALFE